MVVSGCSKQFLSCVLFLLSSSLLQQRIDTVVGQPIVVKKDWHPIGNDIDGEAAGDRSGTSLAMSADGTIIAVGANFNDGGGSTSDVGHVRVYQWNATVDQYLQLGPDIDGKESNDFLGWSLALSADGATMAIGARGRDRVGYVQVFNVTTTSTQPPSSVMMPFRQIGSDIAGDVGGELGDGWSLALSANGTILVVGAPIHRNTGRVRVFQLNVGSTNTGYTQMGSDLVGTTAGDVFGEMVAVSADGTMVAVSVPGSTNGEDVTGSVRVYQWNTTDRSNQQYNQIGKDLYGDGSLGFTGISLALSADGSTIAVGSVLGGRSEAGNVRVYKIPIDSLNQNEYIQIGFDIEGEMANDWFGASVALSSNGTTIAVGATLNDGNGARAGHVRVYQFDSVVGQYQQIGTDIDGESSCDLSGVTLKMSSDGTMIVVGATKNDGSTIAGDDSGHVRVFRYVPVVLDTPSPSRAPIQRAAPCGLLCSIWKFICRIFFGLCSK